MSDTARDLVIWVGRFARPDGSYSDSYLHEQEDKDAEGDQGGHQESSPPPVGGYALGEVARCQPWAWSANAGWTP